MTIAIRQCESRCCNMAVLQFRDTMPNEMQLGGVASLAVPLGTFLTEVSLTLPVSSLTSYLHPFLASFHCHSSLKKGPSCRVAFP